jgi:RimJ/RimL family protein N-acetyltransferase
VHVFMETERLYLRRFTPDDVDNLVELDSDPGVVRYLGDGRPTPRDVVEHEILPLILEDYRHYAGYGRWATHLRETGEFIGWHALRPHDPSHPAEVELGYRLRRSAWGHGYATEGARALIDRGFTELGARRIVATTMTVNAASRRVLEKLGLRLVRTFQLDWPEYLQGAEHGDVEYALDRDDWLSSRPSA